MSATKDQLATQEQMQEAATEVAIRAGLLERCEYCEEVYDPMTNDVEAAYKLGNYLITNNDAVVDVFEGDRRTLTDYLKDITTNYGDTCHCKYVAQKND